MVGIKRTGDDPGIALQKRYKAMTAVLAKTILKAANIAGSFLVKEVRDRLTKHPTGQLAGSFLPATFMDTPKGVSAGAVSDEPHARVQDEGTGYLPGGVITAKPPNKMVAIPTAENRTHMWPREWPEDELTFLPSKKGGGVLVDSADQAQYILKPAVEIEGVNYVKHALARVKKEIPNQVSEDLATAMRKAVPARGGNA